MKLINEKNSGQVSIVIPYWGNRHKYLRYLPECVESVGNQTYKDYEIIMVDNKTDLPSARNEGIKKAKGKYIVCIDVDDTIEPEFLEKTIGIDDIVSCNLKEFGDSSIIWHKPKKHPTHSDFLIENKIFCSSLFKREVWESIGGYDEKMKDGYEDWDFWLRATKAGYTVTIIPDILFNYRKHGVTMISKAEKKHQELKDYILEKEK